MSLVARKTLRSGNRVVVQLSTQQGETTLQIGYHVRPSSEDKAEVDEIVNEIAEQKDKPTS